MVACLREDVSVVRMLLDTGAGVDVRNPGEQRYEWWMGCNSMTLFQEAVSSANMQILSSRVGLLFITPQSREIMM